MSKFWWRIVAIIVFLVWMIVIFFNNFINTVIDEPFSTKLYDSLLYTIPAILSFILIIFPTNFFLYTVMCCLLGIENIIDGVGTNGFLIYLLGCAFAYKARLFAKSKLLVILFALLPLVAIPAQYRLGLIVMFNTFLDLLFIIVLFGLSYVLFNESSFSKLRFQKLDKRDLSVLKSTELEVLQEVLANKTYSTIGIEKNKSESSIKLVMQQICNKLNVKSKKELMDLHENNMLLLPEDS